MESRETGGGILPWEGVWTRNMSFMFSVLCLSGDAKQAVEYKRQAED